MTNLPDGQSDARPQGHVLLVEDSELVTDALQILLEAPARRVSVARTVAEALAVGRADPAQLVLIDLTLPDGDGLDVVGPLRAAGSQIFVALTGHDDPATAARCRAAGCLDVMVKPVPAREFVGRVAGWLGGSGVRPL